MCEYVLASRRSLVFSAFTAMAENYSWRVQIGKEGKPGRSLYEAGACDISHGMGRDELWHRVFLCRNMF